MEDNEMNHAMTGNREQALEPRCKHHDVQPIELPDPLGKLERLLGAVPSKPSAGDRA